MDFLAGYGSGSDAASDKDEQQDHVEAGEHIFITADLKLHLYLIYRILPVFGRISLINGPGGVSRDPGGLLASLPRPFTSGDAATNVMPAPRRARKPVKFVIPQVSIPDSSDEEVGIFIKLSLIPVLMILQ